MNNCSKFIKGLVIFLILQVFSTTGDKRGLCDQFRNLRDLYSCECKRENQMDTLKCPDFVMSIEGDIAQIDCLNETLNSNMFIPNEIDFSSIEILRIINCHVNGQLKELNNNFGLHHVKNISFQGIAPDPSALEDMNLKVLSMVNVSLSAFIEDPAPTNDKMEQFILENSQIQQLADGFLSKKFSLDLYAVFNNSQFKVLPKILQPPFVTQLLFNDNNISSLTSLVFSTMKNLSIIHLHGNPIKEIAEDVFQNNQLLTELKLSFHSMRLPDRLFDGLESLLALYIVDGVLETVQKRLFRYLVNLKILDLHNNQISHLERRVFENLNVLGELYLDNNKLHTISGNIFPSNSEFLHTISLKNNIITNLTDANGVFAINIKQQAYLHLFLSGNLLTDIGPLNEIVVSDLWVNDNLLRHLNITALPKKITYLNAMNNNIVTVYSEESLPATKYPIRLVVNNNPLECGCQLINFVRRIKQYTRTVEFFADPIYCKGFDDNTNHQEINTIDSRHLYCEDKKSDCPEECTSCSLIGLDRILRIDCAHKKLQAIPRISSQLVSYVTDIELNVQNNSIQKIPTLQNNPEFGRITVLLMDGNLVESWDETSFHDNFTVLSLENNKLQSLPQKLIDKIAASPKLKRINLDKNPLSCDCSFAKRLVSIVRKISNFDSLACSSGEVILELDRSCRPTYLGLSLSLAFLLVVVIFIIVQYYRHRQTIKVWLFTNQLCLRWVTEAEVDAHLEYDAFICFAHQDEVFVADELLPALESPPAHYKVCVHIRDFIPGERIETQILHAIVNSRRTIMYITKHFLRSNWAKHEFQVAFEQSMMEKRARLIVILGEDVDDQLQDSDSEMKMYFKTKTYLRRDDVNFWQKLMYAMPHRKLKLDGRVIMSQIANEAHEVRETDE